MKKILSMVCAAILAVTVLAGCAGNDAPGSSSDAGSSSGASSASLPQASQSSSVAQQGGMRTVSTSMGDVEVPADPQRVIATYGMGDVIALGITPIATYGVEGTAYEGEVAHLPVWDAFESEELMSLEPDLILVVSEEQYDEASKVAPTVMVPFTTLSMEERLTFLGEVLNKQAEAAAVLAGFQQQLADAKQQLTELDIMDKTFSLFEKAENGVWVYGDKWGRGGDLIYSHMGFAAPEVIQSEIIAGDQYRNVSMEVIGDYAGDYILFSGDLGDLADNAVWNSIPAVQQGHVIPIDFTLFYDIDIYSSRVQLEYLMEQLLKAQN